MRALVVTNMYPTPAEPARGRFVRDQVEALRRLDGVSVELFSFAGERGGEAGEPARQAGPGVYLSAVGTARRRFAGQRFDVVHAHFGLSAWPALAVRARAHVVTLHGTDVSHPRSRAITLAALPLLDLTAVVSEDLGTRVPRWASRGRVEVLPCGVDLERFRPIDRRLARGELGLDPEGRYLLFPADPARPEKRFDLAQLVAGSVPLLTLGSVDPERVPLYVNAANAVLVTSDREGFGLAVLEALACDVPVLATPHGAAPAVLAGLPGTLCGEFDLSRWRDAVEGHLAAEDPRVAGRSRAEPYSAGAMAERVLEAWRRVASPG
jgi:glycosyltransferase involved in cell wall biosynthesis